MALTGRVIRFDDVRGFGFIAPDGGVHEDVFLHVNDLVGGAKSIPVGAKVGFQTMEGQRGPKAYEVRVLDVGDAARVPGSPVSDGSGSAEVPTPPELTAELTELLLAKVPTLTAAQVIDVRKAVLSCISLREWGAD